MILVSEIRNENKDSWNEFVFTHKNAAYTHLYEWKKIFECSYNLKTFYLGFYDTKELIGILPGAVIKPPLSKPFLVSLPFTNYSGLLYRDSYQEQELIGYLLNFIKSKGLTGFENRKIIYGNEISSNEVTLKRNLPGNPEVLWNKLDAKVRNQVRKAQRAGLTLRWGANQVNDLYDIYARNMLSLGTPVHSKLFFKTICAELKDYVDVLTVRKEDKAVSAMLAVKFKKQLSDPFASSLKEYLSLNPNMLLYWGALEYGCGNGFNEFDFGRSSVDSGTYKFKLQWGARPFNLMYDFYTGGNTKKEATVSAYRGKKAKLFSSVWKKLPFNISLIIGPKLRKYIP